MQRCCVFNLIDHDPQPLVSRLASRGNKERNAEGNNAMASIVCDLGGQVHVVVQVAHKTDYPHLRLQIIDGAAALCDDDKSLLT